MFVSSSALADFAGVDKKDVKLNNKWKTAAGCKFMAQKFVKPGPGPPSNHWSPPICYKTQYSGSWQNTNLWENPEHYECKSCRQSYFRCVRVVIRVWVWLSNATKLIICGSVEDVQLFNRDDSLFYTLGNRQHFWYRSSVVRGKCCSLKKYICKTRVIGIFMYLIFKMGLPKGFQIRP